MTNTTALLLIMDGLRRDALRPKRTPSPWRLRQRGTFFGACFPMSPSATLAISSSIATGRPDRMDCGHHGGRGAAGQVADGSGFSPGVGTSAASPIHLAPSILGFPGRALPGVPAMEHHA